MAQKFNWFEDNRKSRLRRLKISEGSPSKHFQGKLKKFLVTLDGKKHNVLAISEKHAYFCVYNRIASPNEAEPGMVS
jgi:hypothetical protein